MRENIYAKRALSAAYKVHTEMGPGLLESSYQKCLEYALKKEGLKVKREVGLPLVYHDVSLEVGYRVDLLVENSLIIEVKSVEAINDVHLAQVLTYLKLSGCKLGLLLNFNVAQMKTGIKRVILSRNSRTLRP